MELYSIKKKLFYFQLKWEDTLLYVVNGIVLIVMFAICRVVVFPYMFYIHGKSSGIQVWMVPLTIPKKCVLGCALLLVFQIYWLVLMINIAVRKISKYMNIKTSNKRSGKAVNAADKNAFINVQNHAKPLWACLVILWAIHWDNSIYIRIFYEELPFTFCLFLQQMAVLTVYLQLNFMMNIHL